MPHSRPPRYREIEASGPPRELGRQIGEAAGEEVRAFCDMALARVQKTCAISREKAYDVARRSGQFAERYRPDLVDELRGTAEAAGVELDDLLLLQVRNQLQPEASEGCTSLSSIARGQGLVGQNWDNDPALDAATVVITRRPNGKPAYISCGQAGLISYMGFNDRGVGACVNTLPAPSREVGTPHYFTLRELFEAGSLEEATQAVRRAERAIPVNIMLTTPEGPADLEASIEEVFVLRPESHERLYHTNHCLHAQLQPHNAVFPELIQSHDREQRLRTLFAGIDGETDLAAMQQILRDHDNHPRSICRHANSDPQYGFWETVFSIICAPAEGQLYISRGNPCEQPYEVYSLN
ncbi:Acyl-coenzyme A:6-aminopenicillanic acid acyl-transferase [Lignipirellula cremea]|uniref:Acyl-coenzyme A:6-aminopenicillanic acid acyl-transferase n=2 Tax=Lignipirellula cremea TaxID=2528010 RepID=A0A518DV50_9BACT|nr:Acyl-coenzyme A:6-aminopenicillanic acid acyl-transferase [Lignipirellula cremea]